MFSAPVLENVTDNMRNECKSITVNPSLANSLSQAGFSEGAINQLLEIEDEHDDKPFFVFHRDHVHRARSAGPFKHTERDISGTFSSEIHTLSPFSCVWRPYFIKGNRETERQKEREKDGVI